MLERGPCEDDAVDVELSVSVSDDDEASVDGGESPVSWNGAGSVLLRYVLNTSKESSDSGLSGQLERHMEGWRLDGSAILLCCGKPTLRFCSARGGWRRPAAGLLYVGTQGSTGGAAASATGTDSLCADGSFVVLTGRNKDPARKENGDARCSWR